jgi:microcystin synthetase protein McyB
MQLLKLERQTGFKLDQAPLVKSSLIRIGQEQYWFIWQRHHLLTDGWSSAILPQEAQIFYENPGSLLKPAQPYREYLAWLSGQDMRQAEQFWRNQMKGYRLPTPLPGEKPETADQDGSHAEASLSLSAENSAALQAFAQQHRLTLSTVCQAAWALILNLYSGMDEIVFGVTVSGRSAPLSGMESRVGPFINTLPLRVNVSAGTQIISWLQALMQLQASLEQFAYTPVKLLENCTEMPANSPIFKSVIRFQNYPAQNINSNPGSPVEISEFLSVDLWHYPLNIAIVPGSGLQLTITYRRAFFEADIIREVLEKFETILSRLAKAAPDSKIGFLFQD